MDQEPSHRQSCGPPCLHGPKATRDKAKTLVLGRVARYFIIKYMLGFFEELEIGHWFELSQYVNYLNVCAFASSKLL